MGTCCCLVKQNKIEVQERTIEGSYPQKVEPFAIKIKQQQLMPIMELQTPDSNVELMKKYREGLSSSIHLKQRASSQPNQDSKKHVKQCYIEIINGAICIQPKRIRFEDFNIVYLIGSGSFGNVYLGYLDQQRHQEGTTVFAIKQMKKSQISHQKLMQNINIEKRITLQARNNFIVRTYYAFRDKEYYYLAMEWAEGGTVFSLIKPKSQRKRIFKKIGQKGVRFILGCIILGLQYLHQRNVVYNDLKPQNLLIFNDGYVKLTDFGLAQQVKTGVKYYRSVGTKMYASPEIINGDPCKRHVDLWALGVIAYQLSNFHFPFSPDQINDSRKYTQAVLDAEKKRVWDVQDTSQDLKSLINGLLKFEPRVRLGTSSFDKIKNHNFFKKAKFDWQALSSKKILSPLAPILWDKVQYQKIDPMKIRPEYCMWHAKEQRLQTIEGWTSECSSAF